jgi:hypothetical protein
MQEQNEAWPVLGIDLTLLRTEDGGRRKTLSAPYEACAFRPNWRLSGMSRLEQLGAPVLCFGGLPLGPGGRTRAVIVPFAEASLPLWHDVDSGHLLEMMEGPAIRGHAVVEWIAPSRRPIADEDVDRFRLWAEGGAAPI